MKREGLGSGRAAKDEAEELVFAPAAIETVDELIQIELDVLATDAVEGPVDPTFEVPEDRVSPSELFGCGWALAGDFGVMRHALFAEPVIGRPPIREDLGAPGIDGASDESTEFRIVHI